MSKLIKTNLIPDTSKAILAFAFAGGLFTLTESLDLKTSSASDNLMEVLSEPLERTIESFRYLNKVYHNHPYTFDTLGLTYLKEKVGLSDLTARACLSLFKYRYRIKEQEIKRQTFTRNMNKDQFVYLAKDALKKYVLTKRYFFYPFRLDLLEHDAKKIIIPFTDDTIFELKIKDPFFSKVLLKDYVKVPEICALFVDTKQNKAMATLGYYINEPKFETVKEIKEKYYGKVPNLNIFWYVQGKSVGI